MRRSALGGVTAALMLLSTSSVKAQFTPQVWTADQDGGDNLCYDVHSLQVNNMSGIGSRCVEVDSTGTFFSVACSAIGGVSSVTGTAAHIVASPTTGAVIVDLIATSVTPNTYTYATFTVDLDGRLTAASSGTAPVTMVTGTAQRISVTPTTGTPVVDTIGGYSTGAVTGGNVSMGSLASGVNEQVTTTGVAAPLTYATTTNEIQFGAASNGGLAQSALFLLNPATSQLLVGTATIVSGEIAQLTKNQNGISELLVTNGNGGATVASCLRTSASDIATTPGLAMCQLGTAATLFGSIAPAGSAVIENNFGGTSTGTDLLISNVQGGPVVFSTGTASRNVRTEVTGTGDYEVASLSAGGIVKAIPVTDQLGIASMGKVAIATSADVAGAITWPASTDVLVSSGTTTAPIGSANFKFGSNVLTVGDGTTTTFETLISSAGNPANWEFYKDVTPTKAGSIGMGIPGGATTNDLMMSTYDGVSWTERGRFVNGGSLKVSSLSTAMTKASAGVLTDAVAGTDFTVSVAGTPPVNVGGAGGVRIVSLSTDTTLKSVIGNLGAVGVNDGSGTPWLTSGTWANNQAMITSGGTWTTTNECNVFSGCTAGGGLSGTYPNPTVASVPCSALPARTGGDVVSSAGTCSEQVVAIEESGGPTRLPIGGLADGTWLVRNGSSIAGDNPTISSWIFFENFSVGVGAVTEWLQPSGITTAQAEYPVALGIGGSITHLGHGYLLETNLLTDTIAGGIAPRWVLIVTKNGVEQGVGLTFNTTGTVGQFHELLPCPSFGCPSAPAAGDNMGVKLKFGGTIGTITATALVTLRVF